MEQHANQQKRVTMDAIPLNLPTLRFGDSGDAVRVLQRLLVSNGYKVPFDGSFGALTESAVKAFQSRRSLLTDGIVGQKTWRELTT